MKLAVLTDIHANREALLAVLHDARQAGVEAFCTLGDIIGFNGDPAFCVDTIQPLLCAAVRGNHEEALLHRGLFGVPLYTTMMDRTAAMLQAEHVAWLRTLPYHTTYQGIELVHASPAFPKAWQRISTVEEATAAFQASSADICFFGHTHRPTLFCEKSGLISKISISYDTCGQFILPLEAECRYLINPGSVGQPRDGSPKAAYGILDSDTHTLTLRRVEYNTSEAAAKIERTGLPASFAEALIRGISPTGD